MWGSYSLIQYNSAALLNLAASLNQKEENVGAVGDGVQYPQFITQVLFPLNEILSIFCSAPNVNFPLN